MMGNNGLSKMGMEAQEPRQEEMNEAPSAEQSEPGGIAIEDVIKALMSGMSPEELVQNGVPVEMVQQAIQIIQQQAQGQSQAPQGGGLSQLGVQ